MIQYHLQQLNRITVLVYLSDLTWEDLRGCKLFSNCLSYASRAYWVFSSMKFFARLSSSWSSNRSSVILSDSWLLLIMACAYRWSRRVSPHTQQTINFRHFSPRLSTLHFGWILLICCTSWETSVHPLSEGIYLMISWVEKLESRFQHAYLCRKLCFQLECNKVRYQLLQPADVVLR